MKKLLILIMLLFISGCSNKKEGYIYVNDNDFLGYEEEYSFTENTYFLDVTLDNKNHSLKVIGRLLYIAANDTTELNIRLYPNAISDMAQMDVVDLEYMRINGVDMNANLGGNDGTLIHIDLDQSIAQGETIEMDFAYSFNYWQDEGRISYYNENTFDYYITMFFYPFVQPNNEDIEIYDYAFNGESYHNTIGDYYVSIDVPEDFDIAASGKEMEQDTNRNRTTFNYFLNNGRDFSFSTSNNYSIYTHNEYGREYKIYSIKELSASEQEESFNTLVDSFNTYEDYIGEYPYDYFNLEYGKIYGMESSGVIYCSDEISVYTVVHEVVHQWIYSIIHNDQAKEPFLDEALTTYITYIHFYELYGMEHADGFLDSRSSFKEFSVDYFSTYQHSSLLKDIHQYPEGYGYIIYYHGPTVYRYYFDTILEEGPNTLKTFLRAYYDEYAFKEVTTLEMLELLEKITGFEDTVEWFYSELEDLSLLEYTE